MSKLAAYHEISEAVLNDLMRDGVKLRFNMIKDYLDGRSKEDIPLEIRKALLELKKSIDE